MGYSAMTLAQRTALALMPKISASLSVFFSATMVLLVLRDPLRRSKVFHRLILGMSLTDVVTSSWWVASTWPIPRDSGIMWAVGNTATCTVQGFFLQLGIANPLYNLSLSVYYLLAVHWAWGEERLRKVEPLFHLGPLGWGFTTAIIGLPLKIFNNATLWCWIADSPGRNENTAPFRWGIFYAPLWLAVVLVFVNLARLVTYFQRITLTTDKHVYLDRCKDESENETEVPEANVLPAEDEPPEPAEDRREDEPPEPAKVPGEDEAAEAISQTLEIDDATGNADAASTPSPSRRPTDRRSSGLSCAATSASARSRFSLARRRLARQCLRYALVFYMTWFPVTLLRILQAVGKPIRFPLLLAAAILTPLQGLPNFLVYLYPLFVALKSKGRIGCCRGVLRKLTTGSECKPDTPPTQQQQQQTTHRETQERALPRIEEEEEEDEPSRLRSSSSPGGYVADKFIFLRNAGARAISSLWESQTDFEPSEFDDSPRELRWGEHERTPSPSPLLKKVRDRPPHTPTRARYDSAYSPGKIKSPPTKCPESDDTFELELDSDNNSSSSPDNSLYQPKRLLKKPLSSEPDREECSRSYDSPPSFPMRFQSEGPITSQLDDEQERGVSYDSPPTRPMRLASEVHSESEVADDEESGLNESPLNFPVQRHRADFLLSVPMRFESAADADADLADNSNKV